VTDRFEDARGVIQDILPGPIDQVTEIFTRKGSVRGNHIHKETAQWTYVVWGELRRAWIEDDGIHESTHGPGELITEPPGIPHAWKAELDTLVLVFTRGPRSGENYEKDTIRLERPILA
jgi:quercetin dioxygenase-like cupin family protein